MVGGLVWLLSTSCANTTITLLLSNTEYTSTPAFNTTITPHDISSHYKQKHPNPSLYFCRKMGAPMRVLVPSHDILIPTLQDILLFDSGVILFQALLSSRGVLSCYENITGPIEPTDTVVIYFNIPWSAVNTVESGVGVD